MEQIHFKNYFIFSVIETVLCFPLGIIPLILTIVCFVEAKSERPDENRIISLTKWTRLLLIVFAVAMIAFMTYICITCAPTK